MRLEILPEAIGDSAGASENLHWRDRIHEHGRTVRRLPVGRLAGRTRQKRKEHQDGRAI
jgi:hypothetical protein